ncbi:MAG: hypothetical protein ACXVEI_11980 [Actinomycetota bacterium]
MDRHNRAGAIAYWTLVVFLVGFGFLGLLSVGFPFLLLGITLAILSQRRHETGVIAAGVAAVFGFTIGYILVAPLGCTSSGAAPGSISHTVCTNILGIDYSGVGLYNPSLAPGLIAGIVVAVAFAFGARWVARRVAASRASGSPTVA